MIQVHPNSNYMFEYWQTVFNLLFCAFTVCIEPINSSMILVANHSEPRQLLHGGCHFVRLFTNAAQIDQCTAVDRDLLNCL